MVTLVNKESDYGQSQTTQNTDFDVQDFTYDNQRQETVENISKETKKKKAQIQRNKVTRSCRTKISLYHILKPNWQKKFNENKFFRYRVISRRYLRKLSAQTEPEISRTSRKISWDQQIEVVFFKKQQKAEAVTNSQRHKDVLISNQVIIVK